MTAQRKINYIKGIAAEYLAMALLLAKGYRILRHRYKCYLGEIDIICRKGEVIVFVEVKYRSTTDQALFAVNKQKYVRIQKAAEYFISQEPKYLKNDLRIDIITVNHCFFMSHIRCITL